MESKMKLSFLLLLLCISLLSATSLSLSSEEEQDRPQQQYQQCQRSCEQQELGQKQQQQCQKRCKEQRKEDEKQQFQQCQQQCQQQEKGKEQEQQCQQRCKDQRKEQEKREKEEQKQQEQCRHQCEKQEKSQKQQQQCQLLCEEQKSEVRKNPRHQEKNINPFFFDEQSFRDRFRTQEGFARVMNKFTDQTDLLRGIDNYRFSYLEAKPMAFVVPKHFDAHALTVVVNGKGTITLVEQENKETYNIKRGDVVRVPAGTMVYITNTDDKEKLQLATLFQPISVPGQFEEFYGAAGENPRSFYRSFSEDIIQAAFNIDRKDAQRLFGQQNEGEVLKASDEQIEALRKHASSSSSSEEEEEEGDRKGRRRESRKPFNMFNKRPTYSNKYGQLYDVDENDYKQLQDLDISVTFSNISKGALFAPLINTESTRVVFVAKGSGQYQMICPHNSRPQSHSQGKEEERYERVSADLREGTVYVVLAGHPVTVVASEKEDLHQIIFGINAKNNQRNFLAGKENVLKQLEREAKELAFNMPAKEVDQLLEKQDQAYFLPGPTQRQHGRRQGRVSSILDSHVF